MLLIRELDIKSIDDLEKAVLEGKVASLPRIGDKTAENILRQIQVGRGKGRSDNE